MRAAIYCRISRDRREVTVDGVQRMTMLGVERQEQDCRELCSTLGWDVVEVYVDNDISATSGKPRPAYKAMLEAIRSQRVDAIVCWHPDRLYRRTVDLDELVQVCDKHRVPVATVNAGAVDLTTPTGRLVAGLLAQVAKYEGEHKAERWKRSFRQRREQGHPPTNGIRMFGWDREGNVIPEEADAVRWMVAELLAGASILSVLRGLKARGIRTTLGNDWSPNGLRRYLTNPRIAGWVTLDGIPVAPSSWGALISNEAFEEVQGVFKGRRDGWKARKPRVSSLIGILRCGVCGAEMVTGTRHPSRGNPKRTYRCPPPRNGGNSCVEVVAEKVEALVEGYSQRRLADPRIREALAKRNTGDEGPKLAYEIARLEARRTELRDSLVLDNAPVADLTRAIVRIEEQLAAKQEAMASLQPVHVPIGDLTWPTDVLRRNALVSLVVEAAWVKRAGTSLEHRGTFNPARVTIDPRG